MAATLLMVTASGATRPLVAQQSDTANRRGKNGSDSSLSQVNAEEKDSKPSTSGRSSTEIEVLEQACLTEINRLRRAYHLSALQLNRDLLPVAREYSRRMAEEGFFSHTDPEGRSTRDRLSVARIVWTAFAENIASERGWVNPVAVSVHGWMESDGHRRNILNSQFDQTAVGAWISEDESVYFTQIFIKR